MHWVCNQIGSREHYAIPRILHQQGNLDYLLTDFWSKDYPYFSRIPGRSFKKMAERCHPELENASVVHPGLNRLLFEFKSKIKGGSEWEAILNRNHWYQESILRRAVPILRTLQPGIFFSYSYTALQLSRWLKNLGWKIVLGQIDPGKLEEDMVADEEAAFPEFSSAQQRAPANYWAEWQQEIDIADRILVNSEWSKEALLKQGISDSKIEIIPLAYGSLQTSQNSKSYPAAFSKERPLKVLFLGQVNLRKGVHYLVEALEQLQGKPIQMDFVGPRYVEIPSKYHSAGVHFHGSVSRSTAETFYENADLFILPTLSDGFAITQLEALAKGLPLLVSKNCARLVQHGYNGYLLEEISTSNLVKALAYCVEHPLELQSWSQKCKIPESCTMESLGNHLLTISSSLAG